MPNPAFAPLVAFLIHIDAQDAQDFYWKQLAFIPGHLQTRTGSSPESASRAATTDQKAIYDALGIDPSPGGVRKMII